MSTLAYTADAIDRHLDALALAAGAAEWSEASRQLEILRHLVALAAHLMPETPAPGLPARSRLTGAGCEPGCRPPIDDFCLTGPTPPTTPASPSTTLPGGGGVGVGVPNA